MVKKLEMTKVTIQASINRLQSQNDRIETKHKMSQEEKDELYLKIKEQINNQVADEEMSRIIQQTGGA